MGDLVSISLKMPDLLGRFQGQLKRLQLAIASDIQTNIGLRFDSQGAYNGHEKWADLSSGKNLKRAKNGLQSRQVLKKSGALKNSIGPQGATGLPGPNGYVEFEGDATAAVVRVGTNLAYARIHNQGGVISHPGSENGFGRGIKIAAHDIPMPRRNFTDWNQTDQQNLEVTVKNTIEAILNGS